MRANREAFDAWRIVPRTLRECTRRRLAATVLGTELPGPVLLAPVGVLSIVHPEGELAVAHGQPATARCLALGGQDGVRHVLRCLLTELDITLGLAGYSDVAELNPGALVRGRP